MAMSGVIKINVRLHTATPINMAGVSSFRLLITPLIHSGIIGPYVSDGCDADFTGMTVKLKLFR